MGSAALHRRYTDIFHTNQKAIVESYCSSLKIQAVMHLGEFDEWLNVLQQASKIFERLEDNNVEVFPFYIKCQSKLVSNILRSLRRIYVEKGHMSRNGSEYKEVIIIKYILIHL